jgi:periplasmic divalent cation tolerance protein
MNEILILSTTDTMELAKSIANALVDAKEAACVNIVPGIRSVYRWEGKIYDESEFLLLIKSTSENFAAVNSRIRQIHTYKVPEVIAVPIAAGDSEYLNWLRSNSGNPHS